MSKKIKPIIAGNWKMHKTRAQAKELALAIVQGIKKIEGQKDLPEIVLCPPFTSIETVITACAGEPVSIGAQNMEYREHGAYTGEVSAPMLVDLAVKYILIGHSERRQFYGETNATVNLKLKAAIAHKLIPIVCVGESLDEREANLTDAVIARQIAAAISDIDQAELKSLIVAYEPVWAIGTGRTCAADEANRVAKLIRTTISNLEGKRELGSTVPILYGGSVKPSNIEEQLAQSDINGSLVGGASLTAAEFLPLIQAASNQLSLSKA